MLVPLEDYNIILACHLIMRATGAGHGFRLTDAGRARLGPVLVFGLHPPLGTRGARSHVCQIRGGITRLTLLIYRTFSSKVVNDVANYVGPRHYKQRIEQIRPH